jgi:hypothetical protein
MRNGELKSLKMPIYLKWEKEMFFLVETWIK